MAFGPGYPLFIPGLSMTGQVPTSADAAIYSAAIAAATGQPPGAPFAVPNYPFLLELSNFLVAGQFDHTSGTLAANLATYSSAYGFKAGCSTSFGGNLAWGDAYQGVYYGLSWKLVFTPPFPPTSSYTLFAAGSNLTPTLSETLLFTQGLLSPPVTMVNGMRVIDGKLYIWGEFDHVKVGSASPVVRQGIAVFDTATLALLPMTFSLFVDPAHSSTTPAVFDVKASTNNIFIATDRFTSAYATFDYTGLFKYNRTTFALDTTFKVSALYADPAPYTIFAQRAVPCVAIDEPGGFVYYGGSYSQMSNVGPSDPSPAHRTGLTQVDFTTGAISTFNPVIVWTNSTAAFFPGVTAMVVDPATSTLYAGGYANNLNGVSYGTTGTECMIWDLSNTGVVGGIHKILDTGTVNDMLINNGDLVVVGSWNTIDTVTHPSAASISLSTALLTGFNPSPANGASIGSFATVRFG